MSASLFDRRHPNLAPSSPGGRAFFFSNALPFAKVSAMKFLRQFAARIVGQSIRIFARAVTAVRADWKGIEPVPRQRVYFANHTSNADMPMIWSVLPTSLRRTVRPVAAADYWLKNKLRAFVGPEVFNCVLVDRRPEVKDKPMDKIIAALDEGASLIIFPEGNRNMTDDPLLPFKAGLFNLGLARPDVDLVPTWVANLTEIMPKGEVIPLPLICTVTFGEPIHVRTGESKDEFLARASKALLAQRPEVRA